jgi:hypothetical protein
MKYKTVRTEKLKITIKRLVVEKRQNTTLSKFAATRNSLKCLAEKCLQIVIKSFCLAFFEKYGPKE